MEKEEERSGSVDTTTNETLSASTSKDVNQAGDKNTPASTDAVSTSDQSAAEISYEALLQEPDCIEKRFPIDRRKLERLILAGGKDNETAGEYFDRIMKSTETSILWPSRLKLGAKSKKDPLVKVCGRPEGVRKAREILLTELDTKSSKVTLKINVAHAEHSHIIGREGANIKRVHDESQCHIHFPDSNRLPHGGEKSDQVSITGPVSAAEQARKKIKDLQPITVTMVLPLPGHVSTDTKSPSIVEMSQTYNVAIQLKPQRDLTLLVMVKGTMRYIDGLSLSIAKLTEYFTGDYHYIPPVSVYVDIGPQHHSTLLGRDGGNLQQIMHTTCTTIQFPNVGAHFISSQVVITGVLQSALEARQQLLGCLPVALLFDVVEGEEISSSVTGNLMRSLDVFLSTKPKPKQQAQSVIIKSIEQNMECVYEARRQLLESASWPTIASGASHAPSPSPTPAYGGHSPTSGQQLSPVGEVEEEEEQEEEKSVPNRPQLMTIPVKMAGGASGGGVRGGAMPSIMEENGSGSKPQSHTAAQSRTGTSVESSTQLGSSLNKSGRLTVKSFVSWDQKREVAQQAMRSKITPEVVRKPTDKFAGDFFSRSMPAPREPTTVTPKGLDSLNRSGFKALMSEASRERKQVSEDQTSYQNVTDLFSLLSQLGLEKYEKCFVDEEVDMEAFLTMTEEDFKEVGVSTLGARRKLQIAAAEIRKSQQQPQTAANKKRLSIPTINTKTSSFRPTSSSSGKLYPGYMHLSRSGRF